MTGRTFVGYYRAKLLEVKLLRVGIIRGQAVESQTIVGWDHHDLSYHKSNHCRLTIINGAVNYTTSIKEGNCFSKMKKDRLIDKKPRNPIRDQGKKPL